MEAVTVRGRVRIYNLKQKKNKNVYFVREAKIIIPREYHKKIEPFNGKVVYVSLSEKMPTNQTGCTKNSDHIWALRRLAEFFEYVLGAGIDQIVASIVGRKIDTETAMKIAKATFIKLIRNFFGSDFEKMKAILKEVTGK